MGTQFHLDDFLEIRNNTKEFIRTFVVEGYDFQFFWSKQQSARNRGYRLSISNMDFSISYITNLNLFYKIKIENSTRT